LLRSSPNYLLEGLSGNTTNISIFTLGGFDQYLNNDWRFVRSDLNQRPQGKDGSTTKI
jgi:hypothetical protein